MNIAALEQAAGRTFTDAEKEEITAHTQRACRWTFLVSGLEHPNIVKAIGEADYGRAGENRGSRRGSFSVVPRARIPEGADSRMTGWADFRRDDPGLSDG